MAATEYSNVTALGLHLAGNKNITEKENNAEVVDRGIEVESSENLQKIFDALKNEKNSRIFIHRNIQFWKDNKRFQFSDLKQVVSYTPPISFEVFINAIEDFK